MVISGRFHSLIDHPIDLRLYARPDQKDCWHDDQVTHPPGPQPDRHETRREAKVERKDCERDYAGRDDAHRQGKSDLAFELRVHGSLRYLRN